MAHITVTPNHQSRAIHGLSLFVLLILTQRAGAIQFKVGGANGWGVPSNANFYNQWAESNRFQIGDSLFFTYQPGDSVLQVNSDAFGNCSTESPIASFYDGNTNFMFHQSGPYFFISGNRENCQKNEKMAVIVMADRSNSTSNPTPTTNVSPPSPPPSSPASPPELNPSTPPTGEQTPYPPPPPPPNGVSSSMVVSYLGSIGVLGSTLLLVL